MPASIEWTEGRPGAALARVNPDLSHRVLRMFDLPVIFGLGGLLYFVVVEQRLGLEAREGYLFVALLAAALHLVIQQAVASKRDPSFSVLIRSALAAWSLSVVLLIVLSFGLQVGDQFSRLWALLFFATGGVYLIGSRLLFARRLRRLADAGRLRKRVAIFGAGEGGRDLIRRWSSLGRHGPQVVGIYDDAPHGTGLREGYREGGLDALLTACRSHLVDSVIVSAPLDKVDRMSEGLRELRQLPVDILLNLEGLERFGDARLLRFEGAGMVELARRPLDDAQMMLKRIEDIVVAGGLLLLTAPLFAVIALAVKLESPGPLFFVQRRYGYGGRLIGVLKFRSMRHEESDQQGSRLTMPGDSRITRVGRVIRKFSLDELPQLINVLRGEMSMVGPRPHPLQAKAGERLYDQVVEDFYARYRVPPGITGLAQVSGLRGQTDTEQKLIDRVAADLQYIETWSLWLDIKILARTVFKVVEAENAV
ncbi:exopolysaccharide biosynthesis polyprenyl glycosylphosphotransferase [Algihabitans sp.]|uniref:exopolysaccharide biosynthesis polyprenyl glycosylphosphotransferase n=1 Tax=Algihabitans sp. TaxID=2821514 RepID=UPI003BACEEDE